MESITSLSWVLEKSIATCFTFFDICVSGLQPRRWYLSACQRTVHIFLLSRVVRFCSSRRFFCSNFRGTHRQIYGGISLGIAATAAIGMLALSNVSEMWSSGEDVYLPALSLLQRSYIWIRVSKFLWPFVIVIS